MAQTRSQVNSSGNIVVSDSAIDLEGLGDVTIGTSQVELEFDEVTDTIRIQADEANSGIIYLGKTGILSDGSNDFARLSAGEETSFPYNDIANAIYAISDTAAQKINAGALVCV